MARQKTMFGSALNITIHPHSPELYLRLFNEVFQQRNKAKIRGTDWGTIGWMRPIDYDNQLNGIIGEFYKFLNIDPFDTWFNERDREVIEVDEDTNVEPPVPDHLKPHLRKILFSFYPKNHRLIFERKNISPYSAGVFLNGLLNTPESNKIFGDITVLVESSHKGIQAILEIPQKSRIEIYINLPNPDDTSEQEQRVLDRLNRVGARTLTEMYSSHRGETLLPDIEMEVLMNVAKSNGRVFARGYEGETPVEKSTEDYPISMREIYDPKATGEREAIQRLSATIMREIRH